MELLLKQKNKDLYSGEFEIIDNNQVIGNIYFKGQLGSMEVSLNGSFYDKSFFFFFVNKFFPGPKKNFRPYNILENNNVVGNIFQSIIKNTLFLRSYYHLCTYNNKEYISYPIGLGKKTISAIYCDNTQIAQIEHDNTVYNDLHNYTIYCESRDTAFISILIACYTYIIKAYKAGQKVISSKVISFDKTTNKYLLEKYNPNFVDNIKQKENNV